MKSRNVRLNLTKLSQKICADSHVKPFELQRRLVGIPEKLEADAEYQARIRAHVERTRMQLTDTAFRKLFASWL